MALFSLGVIDPFLVDRFSGFDLPGFATGVRLLSDGGDGPHEIIQSSGIPFRRASLTGHLAETADCDQLRAYDLSKEQITFVDGNGNETAVRVLELAVADYTHWWSFSLTLVAMGDTTPPGS